MTDTGAGTPLTAEEAESLRVEAQAEQGSPGKHGQWQRLVLRLLATLDAARSRPATDSAGLDVLLAEGIEAFRLTREYVGEDTLPAIEGWSWFDWTEKAKARLSVADGPGPTGFHCEGCDSHDQ